MISQHLAQRNQRQADERGRRQHAGHAGGHAGRRLVGAARGHPLEEVFAQHGAVGAALGLVGAGGLGLTFFRQMAMYNYGGVTMVMLQLEFNF